ncbi:outer membrane immunogenic protein [Sphingomonas naasensis]|uniref:Porin family protein n=1 Tax=Sphingomonas naasensis TaxID=1344951 RepID=A0A4S1WMT4_9SPHN|nr:outer membrane beta-barrel protein [Sphingomonas naasensis]NIJ21856.1 outer membrane immunogenic protein [Sphingomonas naasensis]TGX42446.1 porin family protein [Sphingomonas naasensis]
MRKLVFVAALVASSALAAPAFAQDSAPSGFRVGVIGGLDIVRPGSSEDSDVSGDDQSAEGFLYGVEAGYDIPLGGAVVGVEAELSDSTGKTRVNRADPNTFGYGSVTAGRDIYVGARVGFEASPGTLVYAKGGYTNARLNALASDGSTELEDQNFQLDGWRLGAGVEKSIGRNTYAKVEYRYSNYTKGDFQYSNGTTTDTFSVDTDRHQIVAGVGFRF